MRTQECLEKYRNLYQISVDKWNEARSNGATQALAAKYANTCLAIGIFILQDRTEKKRLFLKAVLHK